MQTLKVKINDLLVKFGNFLRKRKWTSWLLVFIQRLLARLKKNNIAFSASFLAYSLLLSFIPMLIFLSQVLSNFSVGFDNKVFELINYLPDSATNILRPLIEGMFSMKSTGLSILALFSWLWLGSRGFSGLVQTFNEIFGVNENRLGIFDRVFGVIYLLGFILIVIALFLFNVFHQTLFELLEKYTPIQELAPNLYNFFVSSLTSLMPLLMMTIMFFLFFKFAPATDRKYKIPNKAALIGSLFASVAIILITTIYAFIQNNSSMNLYYGAMAGILALLIWLLMVCQAIVLGAEVTGAIWDMHRRIEE